MTKKNILKRMTAAVLAGLMALTPMAFDYSKVNAWGTPISSGTIHMTDSSKSAQLFNSSDESDTISCNAKAVERDGHWVPVYCIEKGRSLDTGDTVNAEMYENNTWTDQYNMSVRDAIGMIYICGYNGENGWGVPDVNIYDQDASGDELMANGNYRKYVATQALIWEVVSGNLYYSRNQDIQDMIDNLRARITNYRTRAERTDGMTGSYVLYGSPSEAQANPNGPSSIEGNVAHFASNYSAYYNPTNPCYTDNWDYVIGYTSEDFTTSTIRQTITLGWNRVYNDSAFVGQAGDIIYDLDVNDPVNLWGVILWRPENGNQLCISATASAEKAYAAFNFTYVQERYRANATLSTIKVDDQGNPSRGATFTVYNADGTEFGTMNDTDNNGHYSISIPGSVFSDDGTYYFSEDQNGNPLTDPIIRSYTISETSPATEVYVNGQWVAATFAANNTVYSVDITLTRSSGEMVWMATGTNGGSAQRNTNKVTSGSISFGTPDQNGQTVNFQQVNARAAFTIKKEDERGNDARGATFGVYNDAACTYSAFVTLSDPDNDGIYESSEITWRNRNRDAGAQPGIYYIKELTPATEIRINGTWVSVECALDPTIRTVRIVWNPVDGSIVAYLYEGAITDFNGATPLVTKNGSFDGSTSSVSADFTSKPWKNTPYVYANADITIKKVDDQGRDARGAVFAVYSDEACTHEIGRMSDADNNGIYTFTEITFNRALRSDENAKNKVYYVKEISPATEVLFEGEWIEIDCTADTRVRKVTIRWMPADGTIEATLECGDEYVAVPGAYDAGTFTSTVHADFTNSPVTNPINSTGSMRIEKYDEATEERLTGATFRVYNDTNLNGRYDSRDTVYCDALTDDDGDGIYVLEGMPLDHSYLVIEIEAPEYYETDPNYYGFRLTPKDREYTVDNMTWPVVEGVHGEFLNHNPIIGTTLTDSETLEHVAIVRETITLIDTVQYNGLHVGESYVMCGTLYDKATGTEITTAEVTFVPENVSGTVDVLFTVNTEVARNCTFVAGEKVRHEDSEKWVGIHFNLEDEGQTVRVPDIHTTLTDNSTEDHVAAYPLVELTDVISYENLVPGLEYRVTGYLMDKNSNEALKDADGNVITASATFTPAEMNGQVSVVYSFDRNLANGTVLVAFESLWYGDVLIIAHEDIDDVDQTVYLPKIHTTLLGQDTNAHVAPRNGMITLVDTVSYSSLLAGKTYTLTGILVNKDTEDYLRDPDGNVITATVEFTPECSNGTVDVIFTFDSSLLENCTLVAFEELKYNGIRIATHNDIDDIDQTVNIPDIGTTLYDRDLADEPDMRDLTSGSNVVTLVDTVRYENITPNLEYTVYGTLMIKETQEPLLNSDGNPVTGSATFTPSQSSGEVEVTFTVDTTGLEGKHLVAFETLEYNNVVLVIHADINDVNQTVRVPEIQTTLTEEETGDHVGRIGDTVILTDTVSYVGLVPGKTYTLVGLLVNKDTGEYLIGTDGQPISATAEFTPTNANGFVDIDFTVDASLLQGVTVVAFEEVAYRGTRIAIHADIEDEGQTVYFPDITTVATVGGSKVFAPADIITVTDTISYTNLVPGRLYEIHGKLMNSDGTAFAPQGTDVVCVLRFIPETSDGSVEVTFTFNGKDLKDGQKLVVFEDLYYVEVLCDANGGTTEREILIASHANINDADQTVTVSKKPPVPSTGEESSYTSLIFGSIMLAIGAVITFIVIKKKDE